MKKSLQVLSVLIALGIVFGCATVGFGQGRPPSVGSSKVATDDPEVVAAAEFAVSARKEKEGGPLSLVSIKSANLMSTRDTAYLLCLEVKAGDETDAGVDVQNVEVVVSAPLTRGGEKKKWKLSRWEEKDCGGDSEGHHASSSRGFTHRDSFIGTRTPLLTAAITSVYSSLSKCKTVSTGIESSTQACRGVGGYNLQREYSDQRESITVISPNGQKHPLEFWNVIGNAFSNVGEKAEWRVTKKNGKLIPVALIVRFNTTDNSVDPAKPISYLAVAKITPQKICVTDKIAPSSTANEEARLAADASADKPCLEPPQ